MPSLTALRAFEAAARHMSFAMAAAELSVTPAALSYQIKSLEQDLDVTLFHRLNRAVELTEAGKALAPGLSRAFDEMREAVHVMRRATEGALTLTAGPAFTAKWLAPRIYRFVEKHPDIEVRMIAALRKMDFRHDGVDAAIRFTRAEEEPGSYVEVMVEELMAPICAPQVAARLNSPADLVGAHFLHDDSLNILDRPPGWRDWLKIAGVEADWRHGPRFSNADHVLDAAAGGGGVALGRLSLAADDLRSGRLVAPFDLAIDTGAHFNFVCPAGHEVRTDIAALLDWLREELAGESAPGEGMRIVRLD
ncbi:MAG: transcriptional regulator GcvA [Pikeienuella sp.]